MRATSFMLLDTPNPGTVYLELAGLEEMVDGGREVNPAPPEGRGPVGVPAIGTRARLRPATNRVPRRGVGPGVVGGIHPHPPVLPAGTSPAAGVPGAGPGTRENRKNGDH